MGMTSPLDTFLGWMETLPVRQRQDFAVELTTYFPGIDANPYHRLFFKQVSDKLKASCGNSAQLEYGLVTSLCAVTASVIAIKTEENAGWEAKRAEIAKEAEMLGSCSLAESAAGQQAAYETWRDIASSWKQFCGTLSTEKLNAWLDSKKTIKF